MIGAVHIEPMSIRNEPSFQRSHWMENIFNQFGSQVKKIMERIVLRTKYFSLRSMPDRVVNIEEENITSISLYLYLVHMKY